MYCWVEPCVHHRWGGAGVTCERAPVGGGVSGSTHTYGDLLFRFLPSYWPVNGKCVKKTCLIRTGSTVKSCIPDCKHSDYTMKALNNKTNQKKKGPRIRYCSCNQGKTCIRLLERKIWRRNGTAWACMASKETGSLNEVTADGKSSRSSEVYRAALSVRKILQNQQDDASFGDKVPESYPRVSKGE